jgi:hypothetical protein
MQADGSADYHGYQMNHWPRIALMNEKRSDVSATALDGKICITGGFRCQECTN